MDTHDRMQRDNGMCDILFCLVISMKVMKQHIVGCTKEQTEVYCRSNAKRHSLLLAIFLMNNAKSQHARILDSKKIYNTPNGHREPMQLNRPYNTSIEFTQIHNLTYHKV